VVSELLADRLAVGGIDLRDGCGGAPGEVLTLGEVAELLRAPAEDVRARAMRGDLPGRLVVVPEEVGSSGPPWRLEVSDATSPRRTPDEAAR
jgi:hypothetical protein